VTRPAPEISFFRWLTVVLSTIHAVDETKSRGGIRYNGGLVSASRLTASPFLMAVPRSSDRHHSSQEPAGFETQRSMDVKRGATPE